MKFFNRVIQIVDRLTDIGMMLFAAAFILMGAYAAYDSFLLYSGTGDSSILRFKPGNEKNNGDGSDAGSRITGNMVAWLTIDGTGIDYPVMQGADNAEYLNRNPYGEYSPAGSIFLDFRNSGDFTDPYSLIYGHHMEHSLMFGALDGYLTEGYLREHRDGRLTVDGKEYVIRLFAVLETDSMNPAVFAPTESVEETYPFIKENALFFNEDDALKENERLIALSTCKAPDTTERTIVFGALGSGES